MLAGFGSGRGALLGQFYFQDRVHRLLDAVSRSCRTEGFLGFLEVHQGFLGFTRGIE